MHVKLSHSTAASSQSESRRRNSANEMLSLLQSSKKKVLYCARKIVILSVISRAFVSQFTSSSNNGADHSCVRTSTVNVKCGSGKRRNECRATYIPVPGKDQLGSKQLFTPPPPGYRGTRVQAQVSHRQRHKGLSRQ
jgi:hypothetical protein